MKRQACCRGAAALELVLVLSLGLLPLALGILQIALALQAHHTLNLATFMAARAGSVAGADAQTMRRRLAATLVPLYIPSDRDPLRERTAVLVAQGQALADLTVFGELRVLRPTRAMLEDFGVQRAGRRVLPNDALQVRPTTGGARSGVSLQQANVLEIRATWCMPLLVPLVGSALVELLRWLDTEPLHQRCYADQRLPLVSRATVPMHSDTPVASLP